MVVSHTSGCLATIPARPIFRATSGSLLLSFFFFGDLPPNGVFSNLLKFSLPYPDSARQLTCATPNASHDGLARRGGRPVKASYPDSAWISKVRELHGKEGTSRTTFPSPPTESRAPRR